MGSEPSNLPPSALIAGRYVLYDEIGAGGNATVHLGRLLGTGGFTRTVAIKRLHADRAKDPDYASMFMDEARLASRIRHPNVVPTLDVVRHAGELLVVMEYIAGATLLQLLRATSQADQRVPPPVAVAIVLDVLRGLHSAHEAAGEGGEPLHLVHRDVSPPNILVGADGIARVLDFGTAKAAGRTQTTRDGEIKGKASYMSPEQVRGLDVDRRTDTYAASVVLWEALVGARLFAAETPLGAMTRVLQHEVPPPSERANTPLALDAVVMKGLARDAGARFQTASEMAEALEAALRPASAAEVRAWMMAIASESLRERATRVMAIERGEAQPLALDEGREAATSPAVVLPSPRRRRRATLLALAGALALIAAMAVWANARSTPSRASGSRKGGGESATAAPPPVAPAPSVASRPSEGVDADVMDARAVDAQLPSRRPKAGGRPAVDCSPPYRLDPNGIRRPKPECL